MSQRSNSEQVLRWLVTASRSAPEPAIDFETLHASVRRAWLAQRLERSRPSLHWRWVGAVAVAISFFIGGWYGHAHHQKTEPTVAGKPPLVPTIDGRALLLDQELEAGREPLTVNHPGVAKWTLGPGGRAKLVAKGRFLTVQLDTGSIEAEVVPSNQTETFAVESGALRVAVHGTAFAVAKTIDALDVVVSAGTVVVGPSGAPGQTVGSVLRAPARQRFTASVAPITPASAAPDGVQEATVQSAHTKPQAASSAVPSSSVHGNSLPAASADVVEEHPSPVAVETALDTVRGAVARCFADAQGSDPSRDSHVTVRVETYLTITLSPSGKLSDIAFTPPIPGDMVECARSAISDFSTSPSKLGSKAGRQIMLTR